MDCYFLDLVSWQQSQTLYHAAAHLGREALFILRPRTPYVCLGYNQDAQQEIDLAYARQAGLPVFRREVGGGAVYLDQKQLFYQLILCSDHPAISPDKTKFYLRFLEPVIQTFRDFGVPAEFKPVNDILANNRKISGNGAAEINHRIILVGNFILDFNYEMMSKVLRVPDEKFRDKMYKTLTENLTTIQRVTGKIPKTADLAGTLMRHYEPLLGPFELHSEVDPDLLLKAEELFLEMNSDEWLFANDRRRPDFTQVKIREGFTILQKVVKLPGGLVRITAISRDEKLHDVHLSGDFFIYPNDALLGLEQSLEGAAVDLDSLTCMIHNYYRKHTIETPGISPQALAQAFIP
jgi:lipoate-protein ligase A